MFFLLLRFFLLRKMRDLKNSDPEATESIRTQIQTVVDDNLMLAALDEQIDAEIDLAMGPSRAFANFARLRWLIENWEKIADMIQEIIKLFEQE